MGVGRNIRKLGDFLEACEGELGTVRNVEFAECAGAETGLTADVELTVVAAPSSQRRGGVAPAAVELDADGRLTLVLESTEPVVPATDHGLETELVGATVDADGAITVTLDASVSNGVEASEGATSDDPPSSRLAAVDDAEEDDGSPDTPPCEDPDLLARVYDSCETFAEMAAAIEMDVTAETVRRYMIDHGIHEPRSYDTGGDGCEKPATAGSEGVEEPNQSPVVLTDGIGLPDDVDLEGLVETISGSNTVYEVRREFGLDRSETLELLRQLNLLDLVVGRIASEEERTVDREEIVARLRDASATQPR